MAFRVETTEQAERDIFDILDRLISEEAGKAGLQWFEGLEHAIASLSEPSGAVSGDSGEGAFPL